MCGVKSLFPLAVPLFPRNHRDIVKVKLKTALTLQLQSHGRSPKGGDGQMHGAERGSNKVQTASQLLPVRSQGDWSGIKYENEHFNNIKVHSKLS